MKPHLILQKSQHPRYENEWGVGLIEVMIAMFILAFGALAIGNMQASALTAVTISSKHFDVSSISDEILEHLKADPTQAGAGAYNTNFSETSAVDGVPAARAAIINSWKGRAADALPDGATAVDCIPGECTVSLRWRETVTAGITQQVFNLKVPLRRE